MFGKKVLNFLQPHVALKLSKNTQIPSSHYFDSRVDGVADKLKFYASKMKHRVYQQ